MVEMVEMAEIGDKTVTIPPDAGAQPRAHLDHPLRGRKMVKMGEMGEATHVARPAGADRFPPRRGGLQRSQPRHLTGGATTV